MQSHVLNFQRAASLLRAFFLLLACWLSLAASTEVAFAQRPVITTQPVGGTNLTATEITFTVVASGTAPLRYQWLFNSTNRLIGATNSTLTYTNLGAFQEGFFSVVITNVAGAITSNPVFLDMLVPPLVTRNPTNVVVAVGGMAVFASEASGDPVLRYQWYKNVIEELVGETNATLVLTNLQLTNSGTYQIEVANDYDTVNSVEALLTVKNPPVIIAQPLPVAAPAGTTAQFTVGVGGDGPFSYQWFFNGTNTVFAGTNQTLVLSDVQLARTGDYSVQVTSDVGAATSAPASLLVLQAPVITAQPASVLAVAGTNVAFSVSATGTQPIAYQWLFNRTNSLPEATGPTLQLANVQPGNSGLYSVALSNQSGSVTSVNASLSVFVPPQIVAQPTNLTVRSGQTAGFAVTAIGTTPLIYRWFFNQTNLIPGANNNTLSLPAVSLVSAGTYSVSVSNFAGEAKSDAVLLAVQSPPVIVQHPVSRTVQPGNDVIFSVIAVGDEPRGFQWFYNTTNAIAGATGAELTLFNVQAVNSGRYSVRVTNALGTTFSVEAVLTVKRPPVIAQEPVSLTVTQGAVAPISIIVSGDGPFTYRWLHDSTNAVPGTNGPGLLVVADSVNAGAYSVVVSNEVGSATSAQATLTVLIPPSIASQPEDLYVQPGADATFAVSAGGDAPLSFQWFRNETNLLTDATNTVLQLTGVPAGPDSVYSVFVSNHVGVVSSRLAALRVRIPPTIVAPPVSVTSTQGQAARFVVETSGDGPFSYQWFFNGTTPVPGGTASTLELIGVQPTAAGQYSVRVTNVVGSVVSPSAELTVLLLPVITASPVSQVVTQGQDAAFSVMATSETPLTYEWRRNGIAISGVSSTLPLPNVQPPDAGSYDVVVGNTYGAVTSTVATLTVYALDFGDAPEPLYPTLLAADGARHVVVPGVFLGAFAEGDVDGQPSLELNGDDAAGVDDEDGVQFLAQVRRGQPVQLEVVASTNGFLTCWIDLNRANGWSDAADLVLSNAVLVPGTNILVVNISPDASIGASAARFRFTTGAQLLPPVGLAPDGEVEDYPVTIAAAADLRVAQAFSSAFTVAGTPATLTIAASNAGPSAATSVFLTNLLSPRSTFVSVNSTHGSCAHSAGVIICDIGSLGMGDQMTVTVNFLTGLGTNLAKTTLRGAEFDATPADADSAIVGTTVLPQFANSDIIILPLPDSGGATPYPASIVVSGATAAVQKVTVTLRGLNHDFPDDMDILLVGPQGQAVVLMSDSGSDNPIFDATVTFDDQALEFVPDTTPTIVSGSYRPANHPPAGEIFPAPAPSGPYSEELSTFVGSDPNGVWSLYVIDDALDNGSSATPGFIADGWTLNITAAEPLADLSIHATAEPAVVSVGQPVRYTLTVTNAGPSASLATLRSTLPPGLIFLAANTPQGSCESAAGVVTCHLGELTTGGTITLTIDVTGTLGTSVSNVFTVESSALDLERANNTTAVSHMIRPVVDLDIAVAGPSAAVLLHEVFPVTIVVSNRGPNDATGIWLTNTLPAGATFVSATGTSGACVIEGAMVACPVDGVVANGSRSVELQLYAGWGGLNTNSVFVIAAEEEPSLANNVGEATITANLATDLSLTTSPSSATVPLGRDWVIVHTVTNRGPVAGDATLSSALPAGMIFQSALSLRGACTNLGGQVDCFIAALGAGESATITITGRSTVLGAVTNRATVSGSLPDYNPANNQAVASAVVVPHANLSVAISSRPEPVWQNENLTFILGVTNLGPSAATNVAVTNILPQGVTFISFSPGQGGCARVGEVVRCDLGTLGSGSGTLVTIIVRPTTAGFYTNAVNVGSPIVDAELSNNSARHIARAITATGVYVNSQPVTTPLLGLANPFPSTITVSGFQHSILRMRVTLVGLSHSYSDDLDILLVAPDGRSTYLLSDTGGEFTVNNATLTFDDTATNGLADFNLITSGTYRPTNFGFDTDSFSAPAPVGPYRTNLTQFNGTDPNGLWSLYIMDDADKDSGILSGGWRLSFAPGDPIVDLGVAQSISANPTAVGSNVVFAYSVTNASPLTAPNVRLTNSLPDGMAMTSFNNPHGSCVVTGQVVICSLGSIASNGTATMTLTAVANAPGSVTNLVTVGSDGADFRPANNSSTQPVTFELPPVFVQQPLDILADAGTGAEFTVSVIGAAPLTFQWLKNGQEIPGAIESSLRFESVAVTDVGTYSVRAANGVGAAVSVSAILRVLGPPVVSPLADVTVDEDSDTGALPFTLLDYDTAPETIVLSAESSSPTLVPLTGIVFGGAGQNRIVRVTPAANQSGSATIRVIATDTGGASTTNQFILTVQPVIDPILILVQPRNYLSVTGSTIHLSISATSALPIAYQWEKDGLPIPDAISATLTLAGLDATNSGSYRVLMTSADTNAASIAVTVQVTDQLPSPNIVSISRGETNATIVFTTVVGLNYTLEYRDDFNVPGWTPLGTVPGTGSPESLIDPVATVPHRFYRIKVE